MSTVEDAERQLARLHHPVARRGESDVLLIRLFDVIVSLMALTLLLPFLALIGFAVWTQDGGSPLFRQQRIGRGGRLFGCLKFRSMTTDAEAHLPALINGEWRATRKFSNDPRVTRLGRFLRRSSLDELPQLLNVLKGEMSLVGPRPIVIDEASLYGRRLGDYCTVRPGLTGLWQVSGRNDVPYPRRVAMDMWLVRNLTISVYLTILLRTIPAVLSRRGVY